MKKKIIIVSILCVLCIGLISGILFLDNKNVGNVSDRDSNMYSAIRPVFYLTSDTVYSGGNGTASTPYLIN